MKEQIVLSGAWRRHTTNGETGREVVSQMEQLTLGSHTMIGYKSGLFAN